MGFQRAPVVDRGADGQRLLHLAQIHEIFEILRKAEISEHGARDALIAADILLVQFDHRGGDVHVFLFRIGADDRHGGVGLKTEFGAEARLDRAVIVERLVFVPDGPVMHVAGTIRMPGVTIIEIA